MPHFKRSGAYCLIIVRLSVCLSVCLFVCLHKLNINTYSENIFKKQPFSGVLVFQKHSLFFVKVFYIQF